MDKLKLKQDYENACNAYMRAFCEKHDFSVEDAYWVGDDVGGILNVDDMDFDMETIRTDIDEDAPEEELFKWYDYILDALEFKLTKPNFHAWVHGCPRTNKEWFEKMHKMHEDFANEIKKENEKNKI